MAVRQPKLPTNDFHPERYVPYRLLWAKVIVRAAYDFALWKDSRDVRLRNYARDAERWLFDEEKYGSAGFMNSFNRICEVLNIDRQRIRDYAKNLTRDQVKKLEFMEREGRDLIREIALGGKPRDVDGIGK